MQPLKVVLKKHKVLVTLGFIGVAGGSALISERNRYISFFLPYFSNSYRVLAYEFVRGNTRTIDFAWTVGTILLYYKYSFRKVDEGTPKYDEVSHCVNKYAAEKLLRLFKYI